VWLLFRIGDTAKVEFGGTIGSAAHLRSAEHGGWRRYVTR
jgi:hypothetical protein